MAIGRVNTGGGGTGGTLVVTGVAGDTVTVSKDEKVYTRSFNSLGKAVFKGLLSGTWTVTMTNGEQTATRTVTITADYAVTIAYFTATINITYPVGSTCTATDGATTLTAPDTSGTWTCIAPAAGTWTISCTDGTQIDSLEVSITTGGQHESVLLAYILTLFNDGDQNANITGGWTQGDKWWFDGNYAVVNATISSQIICDITYPQQASARTLNSIDLTRWNTLTANVAISRKADATIDTRCGIAISPSTGGWYSNRAASAEYLKQNFNGVATIDISKLTGSFYIYVYGGIDSCVTYANNIQLKK